MTDSQRMSIVVDRWPKVCKVQGWKQSDRELRLRVISDAVGRPITSMLDLNNTTDIDAVFAHLGMLVDNVEATIETDHPEIGEKRRLIKAANDFIVKLGYPYWRKIVKDRFGHDDLDRLSVRELTQIRFTLTARYRAKLRKNAPTPVPAVVDENNPF